MSDMHHSYTWAVGNSVGRMSEYFIILRSRAKASDIMHLNKIDGNTDRVQDWRGNKCKTTEKINETKSLLYEKINKIVQPLPTRAAKGNSTSNYTPTI